MNSTKRIYRSSSDTVIAGVCAGLARYFDLDPVIVRVAFILLALLGGPGILLYVILWVVIPEEPKDAVLQEKRKNDTL